MHYPLLRFIDQAAGSLICYALSATKKGHRSAQVRMEGPVNKIVIMKFWGIGSIIMATPTIRALRARYPGAHIAFFTLSRNAEMCRLIGLVDEVITARLSSGIFVFIMDIIRCVARIRKAKYDLALDMEFFTRFSAIITYFMDARISVGFSAIEAWRGNFHTVKVPFNRYWHLSENFANMAKEIGVEVPSMELVQPRITEGDRAYARDLLRQAFPGAANIVCVNVNNDPMALERRWPKKNYIELINRLVRAFDCRIVLIGSAKEVPYVREVEKEAASPAHVLNLAGRTTLAQLIALFEQAKFLVTNDSGPLHIAAALCVPTVSFFGPETPVLCGPKSAGKKDVVFFKSIDCSPCINVHYAKRVQCSKKSAECMERITVDEVFESIQRTFYQK